MTWANKSAASRLPEGEHAVQDGVGCVPLAHQRQGLLPGMIDQRDDVGIHVKACTGLGHIVGYDQVQAFGVQFLQRMLQHQLGFRRKAD